MATVHALFENLGVLAIAALTLFLIGTSSPRLRDGAERRLAIGLVLGVAAFQACQFPIPGPHRSSFDMRAAPLLLAGVIGGPPGAILAGLIGAAGRFAAGGGAVAGGVVSAFLYPAVGLAAVAVSARYRRGEIGLGAWLALAGAGTAAVLPTFFIGQAVHEGLMILAQRWPVLLGGNVLGMALLGLTADRLGATLRIQRETAELLEINRLARDAAGIGLWRYDLATDRLTWDAAQHALMGVPDGAFEGRFAAFAKLVHEDDWPDLEQTYSAALAARAPYHARFRVRTPGGDIRHMRCSAVFIGPEEGPPDALIGVNMDETADVRLQADLALKSAALDSAICGVVIAAAEGDHPVVYVNRAFTEMTGYAAADAVGRNCRFLSGGIEAQPALEAVRAAICDGTACETTLRNRRKSGELFWNRLRLSAIRDEAGTVTHFIGVQEDVSREIADRDRIAEARDHLEAILTAAPDAVLTIDADRKITLFNREAERLFGWRADEAIGLDVGALAPPDHQARHDGLAAGYLTRPDAPAGPMTGGRIIEARRKDGRVFPAHISLARHVRNGVPAATVIAHDMTAVVESRRALEAMSADLARQLKAAEAANEAKTQFLAVMSHELRTPLNGALGMAQLLAMTPLDARQTEYVNQIDQCGRALLAVIDDLFEMTRLAQGRPQFAFAPVDLGAVASEAMAAVASAAAAKPALRLVVDPCAADGAAPLISDAARLRQVLINLLSNAIKFSDAGVVRLTIRRRADGSATFAVSDEGPGIPPDKHAHVFERFTQLDQSATRRHGGAGLGLAICHEIVAGLGGTISVESVEGQGATFRFTAPSRVADPSDRRPCAPANAAGRVGAGPCAAAVIVDDDAASARVAVETARLAGFETHVFGCAADALAELARWDDGVVFLLDLHMPQADGVSLARAIRANRATRGARIAVLTADASFCAPVDSAAPVDLVLHKPLDLGALRAFLQGVPAVERPGNDERDRCECRRLAGLPAAH